MKKLLLSIFALCSLLLMAANPGDVLVTEVMFDPAQVASTEGQYIELYNTTDSAIDLTNWSFNSMGIPTTFAGIIQPHQFFLLGTSNNIDGGGFAPDAVISTSFFSVDNATLFSFEGTIICQYTSAYFGSGIAAELINVNNHPTGDISNASWTPSTDSFGADSGSPKSLGATPIRDWQLY